MSDKKDKTIYELSSRIEKLQSQKNSLLKEINALEEQYETSEKIYRKYFPYILDVFTDNSSPYKPVLKDLSIALKKGESSGKIEYILKQIQNLIYKEEPHTDKEKKEKPSFFEGIFSSSQTGENNLKNFKQGYEDIVNSLKSTMGTPYIEKLNKIGSRMSSAGNLRALSISRDELFALLQKYLSEVTNDREKISQFVKEIVKKILEIETGLDWSLKKTQDAMQSSSGFKSFLKVELKEMKTSLDLARNLEDLKTAVSGRLTHIEEALKKKTAKDQAVQKAVQTNVSSFHASFFKLKHELEEATKHAQDLETRLNYDPLTKAFNRRAYDMKIKEEMERFLRYGTVFSLLVMDADHFKKINDKYGHSIGDRCLKEIIKRTAPLLRKNDMLARYGGEEFAVIMPGTDGKGAEQVAEKIRQTIERIEFIYREDIVRVTVSIGASEVKQEDASHMDLFNRADTAVYQAKEGGRNRVVRL